MEASNELITAVKGFEGLRLTAYQDTAGVWTIGYGHTATARKGQTITEEQATKLLKADLCTAEQNVNDLGVCQTQGQFDALTDFVFNLGIGNLRSSTLLKYIKAGKPTGDIQAQFNRWVYAGGKKLAGLVKRRAWEAERWAE